jgi:serine/threonine protein kinase/Flp pilus assembly protein TadD
MGEPRMQFEPASSTLTDLSGTTVGRFAIEQLLGRGGMGEVYRAQDTRLKRQVALKRISPALHVDQHTRRHLWKEAECASRLNDPHVAAVYDVIEVENELFIVMEYVEGQTLRRRLAKPFTIEEFLPIAVDCAMALACAHQAGLRHGDVKPENIVLTSSGQVKVLDFGVAKNLSRDFSTTTESTRTGQQFAGTLPYMAPEVVQEKESDARADIFSLGVVFYEAVAGGNPFWAEGFLATCNRILHEDPLPLRARKAEVPSELDRIVSKMLAKDPTQRYSSAGDLAVDLTALRQSLFPKHTPSRRQNEEPSRRSRRRPSRNALIVLAGALCVAVAASSFYRYSNRPVLAEHAPVLLTDVENQTGEKLFDQTVTEALRQALAQSRYVRLVPQSQVLEATERMGRRNVSHVDMALGRELARRENYRALLTGRIASEGGVYLLTIQLTDPREGAPLLTQAAMLRSPSELYTTVDNLAKSLRKRFGESLAQVNQESRPLEKVTTPSLDALQRYSRAMEFYAAADYDSFLPLAKSATELDPGFGMAHLYLARVFEWRGDDASAAREMDQARLHLDRVTERERYLILATGYEFQGLYEKAAEQYRLLTQVYPDDLEGHRGLASASVWSGRTEEGVAAEKQALKLNPNSPNDHRLLIFYLVRLNRFSDALAEFQAAQASQIRSPRLHWGSGLAYLGKGDTQAARREFELLRKEGDAYDQSLSALYTAKVLMYEGRLREAAEALRPGLVLGEKLHSETWIPGQRYLLVQVLWTRRRLPEARAEMRRVAAEASAQLQEQELRRGGLMAVQMGDLYTARKLLTRLSELAARRDSGYARSCYYNLRGAVDLASGDATSAIENQRRAILFFPSYQAQSGLGSAYTTNNEWQNAVESYQRYLGFKGEIFDDDSPSSWVLAHLALARSLAKAGETKQALESYDEFLKLWADADPDLQVVQEARAERDHLAAMLTAPAGRNNTVSLQR